MKGKKRYPRHLIPVMAFVLIVTVFAVRAKQSGKTDAEIQTANVMRGTVLSSVSGNGTLQPLTTVEVKSNVGGQVVELAVDEGDVVRAGQLIARIDPSDTISSLDQAKADYSSAKARVDQSKQALTMQRLQTAANISGAEQALEGSRERLSQA
ncbi:MAG: biotin/lipoyl-binding protein, partial [Armatimonadetes bacterium]|nr:biotin/lipoyl-binding protein [Armatimonadota bacterium]